MKESLIKGLFTLILTCIVVGCAPTNQGNTSSENGITNVNDYEYIVENNEVKLLKFTGEYRALIEIPEYINGLKVTSIGANCFKKDFSINNDLHKKNNNDNKKDEEDVDNEISDYSTYIINENITDIENGAFEEHSTFITPNESEPKGWKDENIEGNAKSGEGNVYFDTSKEDSIVSGGVVYVKDRYLNGIYVARCLTNRKEIKIPSEIKGMTVIDVGREAFSYNEKIEKVTLPNTIGYIQSFAFYNCLNLKEVIFTSFNLSKILNNSFDGCVSLDVVQLPENCTFISASAFANCGELSQLYIPFTMTNIARGSFENTTVKQIIYNGTKEQWGYINIAEDVMKIFNQAEIIFKGFQDNATLNRLNEILNIADNTFVEFQGVITGWYNSRGMFVTDPVDNFSILCYNDKGLPIVDTEYIGKTIKVSGSKIHYTGQIEVTNCQIEILDEPNTEIEPIKVDINDSNLNLEKYINYYISVEGILTYYRSKHLRLNDKDIVIYSPYILDNSVSSTLNEGFYVTIKGWGTIFNQTKEIVCDIRLIEIKTLNYDENNNYDEANGLVFYELGNNECAVGMKRGSEVEEVVIPSTYKNHNVTQIFNYGFINNKHIKKVIISSEASDIKVGNYAFQGCSSLTDILFDKISSIGECAFENCTSLKNVTLSQNLLKIYGSAFKGCSSLTNITLPKSLTDIGDEAFSNCGSLISITIPGSVTNIGKSVFKGCTSLMSVELPDTLTHIVDEMFLNCSSLTAVTLPSTLESIGQSSFEGCSALSYIVIPNGVESIGYNAFSGCDSLSIYFESSKKSSDWDYDWNPNNRPVYLGGDWDYDDNKTPVLSNKYYGLYVFSYMELYSVSGEYLGIINVDDDEMFSETFYCLQITSGKDYENGFECDVTFNEEKICISYADSDVYSYFEIIEIDGKIILSTTASDSNYTYVLYLVKK